MKKVIQIFCGVITAKVCLFTYSLALFFVHFKSGLVVANDLIPDTKVFTFVLLVVIKDKFFILESFVYIYILFWCIASFEGQL